MSQGSDAPAATATPASVHDPAVVCATFRRAVELIGRRWTGAIVNALFRGPLRFNALVDAVPGMSERLCADRLRELEAEGIVSRRVIIGPPLGVEYTLTESGRDLSESLGALGRWAHRWLEPAAEGRQP
jgi:DNA-binding HxlR family transcriptional regulator